MHGFWNDRIGIAHFAEKGWITRTGSVGTGVYGKNDWVVMCAQNGNNPSLTQNAMFHSIDVGRTQRRRAQKGGNQNLGINFGLQDGKHRRRRRRNLRRRGGDDSARRRLQGDESSDYAVAEVITWSRHLTEHEMRTLHVTLTPAPNPNAAP